MYSKVNTINDGMRAGGVSSIWALHAPVIDSIH